jgi:hypothetical protein
MEGIAWITVIILIQYWQFLSASFEFYRMRNLYGLIAGQNFQVDQQHGNSLGFMGYCP